MEDVDTQFVGLDFGGIGRFWQISKLRVRFGLCCGDFTFGRAYCVRFQCERFGVQVI